MSQAVDPPHDDTVAVPESRSGAFPRPVSQRWRSDTTKLTVAVAFLVAIGTAFGGACLGALADYLDDPNSGRLWVLLAYGAFTVVCFGLALHYFRRRRGLLEERGTAYLIIEPGETWDVVETRTFEEQIRNDFAQVLVVPSGRDTGVPRPWSRTPQGAGAWKIAIEQLAASLMAVRHNDDHRTADALFLWSDGVVAAGLGQQLSGRLRDAQIRVRARPSTTGFGGKTPLERPWRQEGHSFRDGVDLRAGRLTVTKPVDRHLTLKNCTDEETQTFILLARCTHNPHAWGQVLDRDLREQPTEPLPVHNGSGLNLSSTATVREIHIDPPKAGVTDSSEPSHHWADYPELAEWVASFWRDESAAIRTKTENAVVLLAAEVPMEVSYGLGVRAHYMYKLEKPGALCFYDNKVNALIVTDVIL